MIMPVQNPEYRASAAGFLLLLAALAPAGLQAATEAPAATDWPLLIEQIGSGELTPARRGPSDSHGRYESAITKGVASRCNSGLGAV